MTIQIVQGDCLDVLPTLPAKSVHCCVTSPPYWGLRDYGIPGRVWGGDPACEHSWGESVAVNATNHTDKRRWNHTRNGRDEEQPIEKRVGWKRQTIEQGQFCGKCGAWFGALGLEPTPDLYCEHMVEIFAAVRGALRDDGTVWLNLGDTYAGVGKWGGRSGWRHTASAAGADASRRRRGLGSKHRAETDVDGPNRADLPGLKGKDLVGVPWRVAFALQADGWYLRQDIIWHKPNPMPESVADRCTKAHEYIFLLSKSERYYYNQEAILEPVSPNTHARLAQDVEAQIGSERAHAGGKTNGNMKAVGRTSGKHAKTHKQAPGRRMVDNVKRARAEGGNHDNPFRDKRNKRSVWTVTTKPYKKAHFATFPPDLIKPCILAGCPEGGTVLDPFLGSGTTAMVAQNNGCNCVGIELNPEYVKLAKRRIRQRTLLVS